MYADVNGKNDSVVREKLRMQKEAEGIILGVRPFRRERGGGIEAHVQDRLHPL